MNRLGNITVSIRAHVPRGSGDEPVDKREKDDADVCSPRERG